MTTARLGADASRKHGRHRTYFGDAVTITLLPDQGNREQGSAANRGRERDRDNDRDRDREKNKDDKDKDKDKD